MQFFPLPNVSAASSGSSHGKLPEQLISFGTTDIPLCFLSFFYAFYDADSFINLHSSSIQNNLKEFLLGLKCIFLFWNECFSISVLVSLLDTILLLPRTWKL